MRSAIPRHNDDFIASQLLRFAKDAAKWLNRSAKPRYSTRGFARFHTVATGDLNYRLRAFGEKPSVQPIQLFLLARPRTRLHALR